MVSYEVNNFAASRAAHRSYPREHRPSFTEEAKACLLPAGPSPGSIDRARRPGRRSRGDLSSTQPGDEAPGFPSNVHKHGHISCCGTHRAKAKGDTP